MHRAPHLLSRLPAWLLAGAVLATGAAAWAQPGELPQDETARAAALQVRKERREAERLAITHERNAMAERRKPQEAACYQRFAVEDCLAQLRAIDREAETQLRARELRLNEEERREKSSERLRSIEQKMNEPRTPPPMQATPRQPVTQPQSPGGKAPQRTPADVERGRATLETDAQRRARTQAEYQQSHERQTAEKVQAEAARRAQAQADAQARALDAAKRRERRDQAVSERKGAPLPVPGTP